MFIRLLAEAWLPRPFGLLQLHALHIAPPDGTSIGARGYSGIQGIPNIRSALGGVRERGSPSCPEAHGSERLAVLLAELSRRAEEEEADKAARHARDEHEDVSDSCTGRQVRCFRLC